MNKKISLGFSISLMIIVAAITFSVTMYYSRASFDSQFPDINERQAMYKKLYEIDQEIRLKYNGEIDEQKLNDSIAAGFMEGIGDSYSSYYNAATYQETINEMAGKHAGIGIMVASETNNDMVIKSVYNGSPAQAAGIKIKDKIVSVNDKPVSETGFIEAYNSLKGDVGTKVKIEIERDSKLLSFNIELRNYDIISVTSDIVNNIGIVTISDFNATTFDQFSAEVDKLLKANVSGIVFDLRQNYGGTLESVSKVLDKLIPAGTIVSATYKDGTTKTLYTSDAKDIKLPMTVVVNGETASAAELFAAVLRDYQKATIVGTKTYGKGKMQTTEKLSDGSAIRFTIALFNPPKSANFDGVGVIPDKEIPLTEEQEKNVHVMSFEEDPQIKAAMAEIIVKNTQK